MLERGCYRFLVALGEVYDLHRPPRADRTEPQEEAAGAEQPPADRSRPGTGIRRGRCIPGSRHRL